jgi:anthranilate phosphoribosyltransferase
MSEKEAEQLMDEILGGALDPVQIGALLIALNDQPQPASALVGFVRSLRKVGLTVEISTETPVEISTETPVEIPTGTPVVIDVCGTGGDGLGSFNVSTCVAFVAASADLAVAKHGNRAVSSQCGSFDVLEALGVNFAQTPAEAAEDLAKNFLTFMFAPAFQPALRKLAPIRKALGIRTILNCLGPMLNPAKVSRQLIGVYSKDLLIPMAEALGELGTQEALVVIGEDGTDEVSLCAPTRMAHLQDGRVTLSRIEPEDFGLEKVNPSSIIGGSKAQNAQILLKIMEGKRGPPREIVLLNSGAALMVGGQAQNISEGISLATRSLDSGQARSLLQAMQEPRASNFSLKTSGC